MVIYIAKKSDENASFVTIVLRRDFPFNNTWSGLSGDTIVRSTKYECRFSYKQNLLSSRTTLGINPILKMIATFMVSYFPP